ncbi:MAG: hypothetical protein QOF91_3955, partial [Alphaproteobacteria bacterium]|nr:hypothetical protein [Alphaproteobacteria bacterium]
MDLNPKDVIASLGGEAAVRNMDHEQRADGLEDYLTQRLNEQVQARKTKRYPTVT